MHFWLLLSFCDLKWHLTKFCGTMKSFKVLVIFFLFLITFFSSLNTSILPFFKSFPEARTQYLFLLLHKRKLILLFQLYIYPLFQSPLLNLKLSKQCQQSICTKARLLSTLMSSHLKPPVEEKELVLNLSDGQFFIAILYVLIFVFLSRYISCIVSNGILGIPFVIADTVFLLAPYHLPIPSK